MKKKNDFSGPPPPQYVRAMRGHTQDPRILYVLPSTTNNIKCTPTRLSESTPDTSQRLCTLVHTQAYMKIRPDKHTCIFRSLRHKKKKKLLPIFLPHLGVSGLDEEGGSYKIRSFSSLSIRSPALGMKEEMKAQGRTMQRE